MPTPRRSSAAPRPAAQTPKSSRSERSTRPRSEADGPSLRPTETSGVFRNGAGLLVDSNGVLLSWMRATESEEATAIRIMGAPVTSPAQLLKLVALDPLMPLSVRLNAAKDAAPYYDAKMPLKVESTTTGAGDLLDVTKMLAMPRKEREMLLVLLKKAGAEL